MLLNAALQCCKTVHGLLFFYVAALPWASRVAAAGTGTRRDCLLSIVIVPLIVVCGMKTLTLQPGSSIMNM
jgi:hypothetical protein